MGSNLAREHLFLHLMKNYYTAPYSGASRRKDAVRQHSTISSHTYLIRSIADYSVPTADDI